MDLLEKTVVFLWFLIKYIWFIRIEVKDNSSFTVVLDSSNSNNSWRWINPHIFEAVTRWRLNKTKIVKYNIVIVVCKLYIWRHEQKNNLILRLLLNNFDFKYAWSTIVPYKHLRFTHHDISNTTSWVYGFMPSKEHI